MENQTHRINEWIRKHASIDIPRMSKDLSIKPEVIKYILCRKYECITNYIQGLEDGIEIASI